MLQIPLSGIKKVEEVVNGSDEYVSLSQGALKVGGIPSPIKQHLKGLLDTSKTDSYGSCYGLLPLRQKIADFISEKYKNCVDVSNVLVTHGAIGALNVVFTALLDAGDEVIIPEPSYPAYNISTMMCRAKSVFVSCLKSCTDSGKIEWELDIEKVKSATTEKTKIIVFSNPSNPIGMFIPKTTIVELLNWCQARGIYLIVDEAYRDYVFDDKFESIFTMIGKSEYLISINTFSKNMAMSGWRIGYLVAHEKLIPVFASIQDAMLNCLNNTAQYAALYALSRQDLVDELSCRVRIARDFAVKKLQPLVDKNILSFNVPSGGFFVFAKVRDYNDTTDLCLSILHNAKLGVVTGKSFGPSGAQFIRICFARDLDVLQEGIDRLTKFFL
ncbi:MAG: Aminotransferase class I and II [candidate division TM6 bacterium GW2011_GWF2_37_49]|nr:MAG: Aminotransferase class I and II [candidate division TM6 bacterium GW2011_GWF2_37_49]